MGLQHTQIAASAVGGLAAMVVVLAMGVLALVVVRRTRRDDDPLFPDIEQDRGGTPDPVAFTEQLSAGGTVAEDVTRAGAVASASGFEQAYALLALVDGDADVRPVVSSPAVADPYAQLARLDEAADDEPALAAFAGDVREHATEVVSDSRAPDVESPDTFLPHARNRRLRARTA